MRHLKVNKRKLKNLSNLKELDVKATHLIAAGFMKKNNEAHSQSCPTTHP